MPKLQGLSDFAEEYGTLRVLDLQEKSVRNAIEGASEVKALYAGKAATDH